MFRFQQTNLDNRGAGWPPYFCCCLFLPGMHLPLTIPSSGIVRSSAASAPIAPAPSLELLKIKHPKTSLAAFIFRAEQSNILS
jgi:hypothetical protein